MGGSITMIIREDEQTIHKMCRWTNAFPSFIKSPKFISKDKQHLQEYLKTFLDMQDDYNRNKKTGKFEHNMTDVYIPYSGVIAPVEYGIIFIDWVTNQIISTQGYSSIDNLDFIHLSMIKDQLKYDSYWQTEIDDVNALHKAGKLSVVSNLRKPTPPEKNFVDLLKNPDLVKAVADSEIDPFKLMSHRLKIDMSPFTVRSYDDDIAGIKKALKDIQSLVTLTKEEEKIWKQFIKDRSE